jgi:hypothetical protein
MPFAQVKRIYVCRVAFQVVKCGAQCCQKLVAGRSQCGNKQSVTTKYRLMTNSVTNCERREKMYLAAALIKLKNTTCPSSAYSNKILYHLQYFRFIFCFHF